MFTQSRKLFGWDLQFSLLNSCLFYGRHWKYQRIYKNIYNTEEFLDNFYHLKYSLVQHKHKKLIKCSLLMHLNFNLWWSEKASFMMHHQMKKLLLPMTINSFNLLNEIKEFLIQIYCFIFCCNSDDDLLCRFPFAKWHWLIGRVACCF